MKKTIMILAAAFILGAAFMPTKASAQQKLGHINSQEIVALMPERDSAMVKLQKLAKELQETLSAMGDDYNAKIKDYQELNSRERKINNWLDEMGW